MWGGWSIALIKINRRQIYSWHSLKEEYHPAFMDFPPETRCGCRLLSSLFDPFNDALQGYTQKENS
jgi:hypothetical protein